jgi:translation elongation factor P/translation initiation factor 5A
MSKTISYFDIPFELFQDKTFRFTHLDMQDEEVGYATIIDNTKHSFIYKYGTRQFFLDTETFEEVFECLNQELGWMYECVEDNSVVRAHYSYNSNKQ